MSEVKFPMFIKVEMRLRMTGIIDEEQEDKSNSREEEVSFSHGITISCKGQVIQQALCALLIELEM